MSLKQECIDMFKLIFKGLSDYEDYEVEEDTGVFLCPKENYIDSELLLCEYYDECSFKDACHKEYVEVDLSVFVPWWAGDEDGGTIYINFNKKPEKEQYRHTIHYINNHKQLIELMYEFKQRVEEARNAYAEYAKKIIELRKYSESFLLQVQKDYPVFNDIKADLPIVFADFDKDENGEYKYNTNGDFYIKDVQLIIHIYDCWRTIDELKTTVRHEILHYILFRLAVNNSDDGGLFHYFCDKYDAYAYKNMSDEEQDLYNNLVECSSEEVSNILEKAKKKLVIGYVQ